MLISWSTAIASAVPDGFPLYRYFRIPSADQGALRQEVGARAAWLPGFEFQTVTLPPA